MDYLGKLTPWGQIVGLGTNVMIMVNWEEVDQWFTSNRKSRGEFPKTILQYITFEELAFLRDQGKIQPIPTSPQRPAKTAGSLSNSVRERTENMKELQMAKTFAFDSENEIIGEFDSVKEAKAHHKGQSDVTFVHEKNFPEGGIGAFATVEDLFPAPEVVEPEEDDKPKRTRTVVNRAGAYVVVKADGARFQEGDARADLHDALMNSNTVEEYLEKAPAEAKFTSARGAEQSVTAAGYMSYAFKRGWITQDE